MPAKKIDDISEAEALLADLGVHVLPPNVPIRPWDNGPVLTNCARTVQNMINKHGRDHVLTVLQVLTMVDCPIRSLSFDVIGAVSDLALRHPDWLARAGDLMDAFDQLDLPELLKRARSCPGKDGRRESWRPAMRVLLFDALHPLMTQEAANVA